MPNKFTAATPRAFNPMLASELSEEARKAVKAAFDAMSAWRAELVKSSEKNGEEVIDKMAAAAQALGWPERVVDATRAQIESITRLQAQAMDHVMNAWEEQVKSGAPMAISSSEILSKLKSLPGVNPLGGWPDMGALQGAAANPMQLWMELASQWQKSWADAMAFWMKAGREYGAGADLRRR
jgi:hypothetical protein